MAYSEEEKTSIVKNICDRIAEDGLAVRDAIKEIPKLSSSTFFIWIDEDEIKSKQYARAMSMRSDRMFEEMLDIADDATNDWMEKIADDGKVGYVLNGEHVQRSKLRIDTRKWHLSKLNPKKYGDKLDLTSDNEKLNPVQVYLPDNNRK